MSISYSVIVGNDHLVRLTGETFTENGYRILDKLADNNSYTSIVELLWTMTQHCYMNILNSNNLSCLGITNPTDSIFDESIFNLYTTPGVNGFSSLMTKLDHTCMINDEILREYVYSIGIDGVSFSEGDLEECLSCMKDFLERFYIESNMYEIPLNAQIHNVYTDQGLVLMIKGV